MNTRERLAMGIAAARVRQDSDDGWIARIGARLKGEMATALRVLQPYGRINVYKPGGGIDVARFIGPAATTDVVSRIRSTFGELACGATLALSPANSIYGEGGKLWTMGGAAKTSVQGALGLRVKW